MSCHDLAQKTGSRCAAFAQMAECRCEKVRTSEHSPGPVSDGEFLIRHIFSPLHVDAETRTLRPQAFQDLWGAGLSVTRKDLVSREDFESFTAMLLGVKRKRNPLSGLAGVLFFCQRDSCPALGR